MVLKLLRKRDPRGWREIGDLARVASVSYALCPDCIGILCLALTGVVFGPDCIGILCSVRSGVVFGADCIGIFSFASIGVRASM